MSFLRFISCSNNIVAKFLFIQEHFHASKAFERYIPLKLQNKQSLCEIIRLLHYNFLRNTSTTEPMLINVLYQKIMSQF